MIPDYSHIFIGHSNTAGYRKSGSSGGVGTELLGYLLSEGKVDVVIGVGYDERDVTQPVYKPVFHTQHICQLSGSKYVYMELVPLLEMIKTFDGRRIAVVVQPCFARVVRQKYPNIDYLISFFCGYNIVYDGTTYLIGKSGVQHQDIRSMEYRAGEYPGGFTITKKNGEVVHFGKEYYELVDLVFLKEGCSKCTLFISDTADVVLGDAWIQNAKNETAVLTNTPKGDDILKELNQKDLVTLYDIEKEELNKMHHHNIHYKSFGHSWIMSSIVKIFNNRFAAKYAPFHLLGFLSKLRRKMMIGIDKELVRTEKYN